MAMFAMIVRSMTRTIARRALSFELSRARATVLATLGTFERRTTADAIAIGIARATATATSTAPAAPAATLTTALATGETRFIRSAGRCGYIAAHRAGFR
jgi:hypothetical protein